MPIAKNTKKNSSTKGKKKKISLSFLEKKIISLPVVKKEEKTLLIITFLIFCLTLIIFWEIRKPQTVVVVMPPQAAADNKSLASDNKKEDEVGSPVYWYSFGDNFSSNAYLNIEQTNMHLDDTVSALMFPPKYKFANSSCDNCDLGSNVITTIENVDYLSGLNSMPQPLPKEVENKEVVAANLSVLDTKQVASFVIKNGSEEQALVYFLDGEKYVPIITDKTKEKIITKYGRLGGIAVAGGSDDNFIILYSGYEGMGYHYLNGKLYDISKFFGLRVVGGGFFPDIISQGEGNNLTWYVVSRDRSDARFIKLWQNNTPYIQGSVDLSYALSKELNNIEVVSIGGGDTGELRFLLANNQLITFLDQGFDNSQVRQVVSKNINTKNYPVYKAMIKAMGVCLKNQDNTSYHEDFPSDDIDIYLGDSMSNFKKVVPQIAIPFSGTSNELFFRIVFYPTPEDSTYSPWLDNVNDLGYLVSF